MLFHLREKMVRWCIDSTRCRSPDGLQYSHQDRGVREQRVRGPTSRSWLSHPHFQSRGEIQTATQINISTSSPPA